jgi:NACHT domain- and WD repeat-containing protein
MNRKQKTASMPTIENGRKSCLCFLRHKNMSFIIILCLLSPLEPLVREKLMSGKLLIEWRHDLCAEITKKRYINDQETMRMAHAEIVNLFFPQETSDESDEINSETSDKSSEFPPVA